MIVKGAMHLGIASRTQPVCILLQIGRAEGRGAALLVVRPPAGPIAQNQVVLLHGDTVSGAEMFV